MRRLIPLSLLIVVSGCESVPTQPLEDGGFAGTLVAGGPIPSSEWIRITTQPGFKWSPKIDGDLIVWEDLRNGNMDIFMFDLAAGVESPVSTLPAWQKNAHVSGGRIVWQDRRSGNMDIWMYDVGSGLESRISDDPGAERAPRISGDRIVWEGDVAGGMPGEFGVFLHDLTTGSTRLLQASHAGMPELDGDLIVSWWHCPYHPFRGVCLYDLATDRLRSISPLHGEDDRSPAISDNLIAWTRYPAPGWPVTPRDIYAYDLVTNAEIAITNDRRDQDYPRVSGDRIVWIVGSRTCGAADLMVHDLSTGRTEWLACGIDFSPPDISGHRVVFIGGGGNHVYMIELATPVGIDIKPGSDPNCIREGSRGRIAVAVLAAADFDPAEVDPATVHLDDVVPLRWSRDRDVNGDGLPDFVFHFDTPELAAAGLLQDGIVLTLEGELFDGTPIAGSDVIHLAGGPHCS